MKKLVVIWMILRLFLFANSILTAQPVSYDRYVILDSLGSYQKTNSLNYFLFNGFRVNMDERRLKYNLIKLTRFSKGNAVNFYEPLELFAWRMNRNSETIKRDIMGWVMAGLVAQQGAKRARSLLQKYKIHNIYPNLTGLHMRYPAQVLGTSVSASVYPDGQAINMSFLQNQLSLRYYRKQYSESINTVYRFLDHDYIILSHIQYKQSRRYQLGFGHYQRYFQMNLFYTFGLDQYKAGNVSFILSWVI